MSLERKDVRLKMAPDAHADLALLAEIDGLDIGEWAEAVLVREIERRVHAAQRIAAARAARGKIGE